VKVKKRKIEEKRETDSYIEQETSESESEKKEEKEGKEKEEKRKDEGSYSDLNISL
jgi:hypothetical protein